jgi:hypothetical protein
MRSRSLKQPNLGCDVLATEGTGCDLVAALVASLVATLECEPPWGLHAHCAPLALRVRLRLVLGYTALQHHLAHGLGAAFKRACEQQQQQEEGMLQKVTVIKGTV